MCQLDRVLLGMAINLFIKHDSACLYFPLTSSSQNCNFYLFLYGRKNKTKNERFHLYYEPLSSDLLNGNCSWKVWTVPLFPLMIANTKPQQQKRNLYCLTLSGDFLSIVTSPCLFPLSSSAQPLEICHNSVVQQSGRQRVWISSPVWPWSSYVDMGK